MTLEGRRGEKEKWREKRGEKENKKRERRGG